MKNKFLKAVALSLCVIMIISVLPMSVFALDIDSSMESVGFTVVDNDESTLAPGVRMNEVVLYNKNNQRVEMYVTTVDTTLDTIQVKANYKDNQNQTWGMQTLSDQVAAMEKNYDEPFKIVAGINANYYDTNNGRPLGAFVMEGVDASNNGDGYSFFAVLKDGTYMIGDKGEFSKYKDQIWEAVQGHVHLVNDGKIVSGLDNTQLYPRQTLGLTADGKLILMTADGSQAPTTVGLTIQEQAEVMLAMGCVEAIHLDGGNSATFGAVCEGTDEFVMMNSPSGGAERDVSNTLVIVSTAVADGTFDHAVINSEYDYLVPNSDYTFTAFGVDATNAPAEMPATATWALSDSSFGTISDGRFVSNGKLGKVDVQLIDNGVVIGSKSIEVVNPTEIAFDSLEATIPYGKTATLSIAAKYGNFDVYAEAEAYNFVIDPATAGTMSGFDMTAATDESISACTVTATYRYASIATTMINVKFGKGSEILFDFETGDISEWKGTEEIGEWIDEQNELNGTAIPKPSDSAGYGGNEIHDQYSSVFLATEENGGKVKNGQYSLGFRMNHLSSGAAGSWIYNYLYYTGETKVLRDVANGNTAIRIGMWVYFPDVTNIAFRLARDCKGSNGASYMYSDYDGKKVSYNTNYAIPESGWIYVYYDLTDYPNEKQTTSTISSGGRYPYFLQLFAGSASKTLDDMIFYIDDITLDYSEVTEDRDAPTISEATVSSDATNYVALNGQTVNSNLLSFSAKVSDVSDNSNATGIDYTNSKIYIDGIDVTSKGKFTAAKGYLNLTNVYLVDGEHAITFVIFDKQGNETKLTKSIVVEGSAGNVAVSIAGHNDGNNTPKAGSIYYVDIKASDAAKIKELVTTLKLNSANRFEYENIICAPGVTAEVSYDALDFELNMHLTHDGTLSGEAVLASVPVRLWSWDSSASCNIPVINVKCETVYGEVTYISDTYNQYVCGFYDSIDVATELDNATAIHKHNTKAIVDKAATCTENGYTGRTYCDGCNSVIDWGTTIPATGHDYISVDGELVCSACKDKYTTDGWVEINGKLMFITNGRYVTGMSRIDTKYYNFDTNGVAYDGIVNICGTDCLFEDGISVPTDTVRLAGACGENAVYVIRADGSMEVGGFGAIYDFNSTGMVPWYQNNRYDVKTLFIGKDITVIGSRAFWNLWYLEKVTFEEGSKLEEIKMCGLGMNNKLTELVLPDGLKRIGDASLRELNVLQSITIPSTVNYIVSNSFYKTTNVTLKVASGSYAESYAIKYGLKYESFEEPEYVLDSGECGDNVSWAYSSKGVLTISGSGAMADYETRTAPWQAYKSQIKKIVIGKDITYIGKFNFMQCSKLVEVVFEDDSKLECIGWGAFGYCESLTDITIPASVKKLEWYAFYYCTGLKTVNFDDNSQLTTIGGYTFWNDAALVSVYIPDRVTAIGENGFLGCMDTATFYVANSTYGHDYFKKCKIVTREPMEFVIAEGTCGENVTWSLSSTGVLSLSGSGAMADYETRTAPWQAYKSQIKKIVIGKDITYIGKFNFMQCSKLSEVVFEDDSKLECIGWGAFGYCDSLTDITIPASVKELGEYAFYYCTGLKNVNFDDNSQLTTIGGYAFWNDASLVSVSIPNDDITIGENAFLGTCIN